MTKIIGHHYAKNEGKFETFEIEVKETAKQFSRSSAEGMRAPYEYWAILPKIQLDILRVDYGRYYMYSRQKNMVRFKELVIADLERISVAKKIEYDKSLEILRRAQNEAE